MSFDRLDLWLSCLVVVLCGIVVVLSSGCLVEWSSYLVVVLSCLACSCFVLSVLVALSCLSCLAWTGLAFLSDAHGMVYEFYFFVIFFHDAQTLTLT